MNLFLAVLISVSVVTAIALLAVFGKKKSFVGKASVAVLLTAVMLCTGSVFVYAEDANAPTSSEAALPVDYSAPEARSLKMVYAFIAEGDYEEAKTMLDGFENTTLYSQEYALCRARLAAINGDYKAARLLYEKSGSKLTSGDIGAEYTTVCNCLADAAFDSALLGASSDYVPSVDNAFELSEQAKQARSALKATVLASVDNELSGKSNEDYRKAVQLIKEINTAYDEELNNYWNSGSFEQLEAFYEGIEDLEENSEIAQEASFRMAKIKLYIMNDDYDGLAESLNENSDYHELLVVTELYINGYIKESDFSKKYGSDRVELYEKVYGHLETLNEEIYSNKTLRKAVSDYLDSLEEKMEHPALTMVEDTLLNYAQDINVDDRTKIYLELAKYELHKGDTVTTNQHITNALNMVTDCTDADYMDAMCELISIIHEKDDPESMKNLATYVQEVSKNSTTVKLSDWLMEKNPYDFDWDEDEDEDTDDKDLNDEEATEKQEISFDNYLSDYVSKKRTSLNILNVDTTNFPQISFDLAVDSEIAYTAEQLKELILLSDCGVNISDFTLSDITYSKVNMVLVCDQSGSMSGSPIEDLKTAVSMFVNNKTENENIGLITFDSYVSGCYGLDTSVEELNRVINNIYASGGTNIYDAVVAATSMLTGEKDALNVIIVLSDGQDGNYHSQDQIYNTVVAPCLANNTLVYSLGLGSGVDATYLDYYASPTGGSYLHIVNSATLSSFYDYLHSMVLNRYRVTFTAQDTLHYSRTLKVESKDDELAYDSYNYKLGDDSTDDGSGDSSNITYQEKYVSGLNVKFLYSTNKDQVIQLNGKGFASGDSLDVVLKGKINYRIKATYVSDTQYNLTIPGNILDGSYDMEVTLNGMVGIYQNELSIGDELQETTFGPYRFTSFTKEQKKNGVTVLDGYVSMNNWLFFKGPIELHGNLEMGDNIRLVDNDGSYVKFSAEAEGLAKNYYNENKFFELEPLKDITLYDDSTDDPDSLDYDVDETIVNNVFVQGLLKASSPRVSLYPNFIKVRYDSFTTQFPFQEQILSGTLGAQSFFNFSASSDLLVSAKNIGTRMEAKYGESGDVRYYRPATFGNMTIGVSPNDVGYVIDTYNGIYNIKCVVKFDFMNLDGLGLELEWTDNLKMKKVWVNLDTELKTNISGVPISFSNFWLGADDIDITQPFYLWTLTGQMDIQLADATEVVPGLDLFLKDTPVLELEDTALELAFGKGYVKLSTKCKFLGEIDFGSVEIIAGKTSFTNAMLGMHNVDSAGLLMEVNRNIDFDWGVVNGSIGGDIQLSINNRFVGISGDGHVRLAASLWFIKPSVSLNGSALIGVVMETDGDVLFTIRARAAAGAGGASFRMDFERGRWPSIEFKKI